MSRAATQLVTQANLTKPRLSWLNPAYLPLIATLFVVVALATFGGLKYDGYLNAQAVVNLFNNSAYLGIVAIGMTFVILSGGIDLSVGSAIAFSTVLMAVLVHPSIDQQQAAHAAQILANSPSATVEPLDPATLIAGGGLHPIAAAFVTLVVGSLFGLSMGFLIATYDLPPCIITLAGMFLARAMGFVVLDFCSPASSGAASMPVENSFYRWLGENAPQVWTLTDRVNSRGRPLPDLPIKLYWTSILMLVSYVVAIVVLHFTSLGRNVYAVGGDENSAKLLGVRVPRVKMTVYAVSGFCAALAGVVASLDSRAGNPADKVGTELDAIAAVVIGGTLLTGGRGFVLGTLLGVLVFALIQGFIPVSGGKLDAQTTRIFIGAMMLAFILLQSGFNILGRWLSAGRST